MADFRIYRFSRHPQYLGWIVWSYGLMIYFARHNEGTLFKLGWGYPDSLPFLLSAAVIVGVALLEEIRMRRLYGEAYENYARQTVFLFPMPRRLSNALAAPMRFVLKKTWPDSGKQVAVVVGVYLCLLMMLSVPQVLFEWPPRGGWWGFPFNVFPFR